MAYVIHRGEAAPDAVRRILGEQNTRIQSLLGNWSSDPAVSIHRARQACKRIRALLRLVRTGARYVYEVENHFYRDIQRRVAYARDAAAMVEALDLIGADVTEPRLQESVGLLRTSLAARAVAEVSSSESRLAVAVVEACQELGAAERRIRRLPLDDLRRRDLRAGAARTAGRCRAGYEAARTGGGAEVFHGWRKHVKYALHQDRLLAETGTAWSAAESSLLAELAEVLGQAQDLVLLETLFRAQPDTLRIDTHIQRLRRLVAERQSAARVRALELGLRLFAREAPAGEGLQPPGAEGSGAPHGLRSRQ